MAKLKFDEIVELIKELIAKGETKLDEIKAKMPSEAVISDELIAKIVSQIVDGTLPELRAKLVAQITVAITTGRSPVVKGSTDVA